MTGTGSGKTESFLLPILGKLAREAAHQPSSFANHSAVRAMILYPMNAAVATRRKFLRKEAKAETSPDRGVNCFAAATLLVAQPGGFRGNLRLADHTYRILPGAFRFLLQRMPFRGLVNAQRTYVPIST